MSKKAKLKILYEDDRLDLRRPWTCSVELRRWQCGEVIDYVLELAYTTDEIEPGVNILNWRKMVVITRWLDAESDAEAIRKAIKIQKRLETGLSNMTAGAQDALMLEADEEE